MQMTTALNLAVAIWTILGVLFIAVLDYRKQPPALN